MYALIDKEMNIHYVLGNEIRFNIHSKSVQHCISLPLSSHVLVWTLSRVKTLLPCDGSSCLSIHSLFLCAQCFSFPLLASLSFLSHSLFAVFFSLLIFTVLISPPSAVSVSAPPARWSPHGFGG